MTRGYRAHAINALCHWRPVASPAVPYLVHLSAKFVAKAREHRRRESGACGLEGISAQGFSASLSFIMIGESNPERTAVLKHLAHGLPTRDRQRSYCQKRLYSPPVAAGDSLLACSKR